MNTDCFERIDGVTPNGGAYSIIHYFDKDKKPCAPQKASFCEVIEYDKDDKEVYRTYASV